MRVFPVVLFVAMLAVAGGAQALSLNVLGIGVNVPIDAPDAVKDVRVNAEPLGVKLVDVQVDDSPPSAGAAASDVPIAQTATPEPAQGTPATFGAQNDAMLGLFVFLGIALLAAVAAILAWRAGQRAAWARHERRMLETQRRMAVQPIARQETQAKAAPAAIKAAPAAKAPAPAAA